MSAHSTLRLVFLVTLCGTAMIAGRDCRGARIEAVQGKSYPLAQAHGPWMIMVASFHPTGADGETDEGKTPQQAADALVYELRTIGIPAYTYAMEADSRLITTVNREGQAIKRKNLHQVKSLGVIAGNYPSFNDEKAQQTLAWIKKFNPKCLQEGVIFQPTPGRPSPLSAAFLCPNPLLSPDDIASHSNDPLLRRLNGGVRHSLSANQGEYTLVVAHFGGKTINELPGKQLSNAFDFFKGGNDLDDAAQQANDLAVVLRQQLDPAGRFNNLDAYVWHDRFESVVTVGSFSSKTDPAIEHYRKLFSAQRDPRNGGTSVQFLTLAGNEPRTWAFVPTPQLMRVPKLR